MFVQWQGLGRAGVYGSGRSDGQNQRNGSQGAAMADDRVQAVTLIGTAYTTSITTSCELAGLRHHRSVNDRNMMHPWLIINTVTH